MHIVVGVIIALAILAFVVWLIYTSVRQRNVWISHEASLPWSSQDAAAHVLTEVTADMQRWRYRLTSQAPTGIVFSYRYRPAWLAIPCIIFFPIGLLSLFYTKTVDISFTFVSGDNGETDVMVIGQGSPYLRDRIRDILADLQSLRDLPTDTPQS